MSYAPDQSLPLPSTITVRRRVEREPSPNRMPDSTSLQEEKIDLPTMSSAPEDAVLYANLDRKHDGVHKFTRDVEPLRLDGSNIARLKLRTAMAIFDMTGVPRYWEVRRRPDSASKLETLIDRCAVQVIYMTLHKDLKDMVGEVPMAAECMAVLETHFCQGGRTSQHAIFLLLVER